MSAQSGRRKGGAKKPRKLLLSGREVELLRILHEEYPLGHPRHVGYRQLTRIFECSYTYVANICRYRRR